MIPDNLLYEAEFTLRPRLSWVSSKEWELFDMITRSGCFHRMKGDTHYLVDFGDEEYDRMRDLLVDYDDILMDWHIHLLGAGIVECFGKEELIQSREREGVGCQ